MTDTPPPLPPFEEDGYLTAEPAITFTIRRIVGASKGRILRAWTDPELFKRWVVPPGQELASFSFEPRVNTKWRTKTDADGECVEHVLDGSHHVVGGFFEAAYTVSAVPGMPVEHPVHMLLTLGKPYGTDRSITTRYKLKLSYHNATLWRHTSRVDLHTFWLEATERLTRLVEQESLVRKAAA